MQHQHLTAEPSASNNLQQNNEWEQYSIPQEQDDEDDDEDDEEEEAHEYEPDCNSDENGTDPHQGYIECSTDQNETDTEEDYLEQNTLSCDQLFVEHQHSELQQLEQSWNHVDSVIEQAMMITEQEVIAVALK